MHTLLPYDDFGLSALALEDDHLKQQIADCTAMLETLHETDRAVDPKDPTIQAWRGFELQLCEFGLVCTDAYLKRRHMDKWTYSKAERLEWHLDMAEGGDMSKPPWFGVDWVHLEYK